MSTVSKRSSLTEYEQVAHVETIGLKVKQVDATNQQVESLNKLVKKYEKDPIRHPQLSIKLVDGIMHPDTLFVDFGFILIGIEPDGYSHS